MRTAVINRKTMETDISLTINLDGTGIGKINTGIGFLDHMLNLFANHGKFDIDLNCVGDTYVDYHHSVEDIGICFGQAFLESLGEKRGIKRYAHTILPMDEALILSAVDISGRFHLSYDVSIPSQKVGSFDTELIEEFWLGFARNLNLSLHIKQLDGKNSHHIIEGIFKSVARSLKTAVEIDKTYENEIPSTKGVL